jgi:FixJ family two-component response regulator
MSHATPIVFVVDDDVSVRESLELLIRSAGWEPETFESAQEFLSRPRVIVPSCLVLDLSLPGLNGLEVQERVAVDRTHMPIIFITGYGDVPTTVQLQGRYASLSHREREVMALVCHRFGASVSRSLAAPQWPSDALGECLNEAREWLGGAQLSLFGQGL